MYEPGPYASRQVGPSRSPWPRPIALYIHIPFCETRCPYCDFNTYAGIETLIPEYVDALVQEVRLWGDTLLSDSRQAQSVNTVFFGGGTPSYLRPEHIRRVLDTVRSSFSVESDAEVTLESNPGDVTHDRLRSWLEAGVNRLSMGVQSLDDGLLRGLGRRHNAEQARQTYAAARESGFDNMSLDLMYGLPRQTLAQWQETLVETLALRPEHLSMYCLTLEEGTPLEAWVRQGHVPEPDPDLAADMYVRAEERADTAGYEHYEISNWALPGRASRHNLTYWKNTPYLGVGPGAHSYMGGHRFANVAAPRQYIQRVQDWSRQSTDRLDLRALSERGPVDTFEAIDQRLEMAETMMMGLRLASGVTEEEFKQRFGTGIQETYGPAVDQLREIGLLHWQDSGLVLTPRGRLLGNEVFLRFLG